MPIDPMLLSDATADLLAEQRSAQLERCGISVVALELPILTPLAFDGPTAQGNHTQWAIYDGVDCVGLYDDDDEAYAHAYKFIKEQD